MSAEEKLGTFLVLRDFRVVSGGKTKTVQLVRAAILGISEIFSKNILTFLDKYAIMERYTLFSCKIRHFEYFSEWFLINLGNIAETRMVGGFRRRRAGFGFFDSLSLCRLDCFLLFRGW